ncbi:hypothetical protein ACFWOT_09265 [Streptomyces sp. NPDC058440]|uniref:hypothetical protein n=1 Tax=Streptomyces sp. NPDC058440 TaxID=3346501 RepID=UPI0036621ED1
MGSLPDNSTLLKFYRDGLSDAEIAEAYGVSVQAVNKRFARMDIERKPWTNTATAILNTAWPTTKDFKRSEYTHLNRARSLFAFMRWRLGDPTLTDRQLREAERFGMYVRTKKVVLGFDLSSKNPWVWLPREESDGNLVLRWPEGRETPLGPHLAAITLPDAGDSGECG